MSTSKSGPIVDADGHVLEPLDTWQKYIDPKYRDRAVRLEHDENGWEVLLFDNKPCETVRRWAQLAVLVPIPKNSQPSSPQANGRMLMVPPWAVMTRLPASR